MDCEPAFPAYLDINYARKVGWWLNFPSADRSLIVGGLVAEGFNGRGVKFGTELIK